MVVHFFLVMLFFPHKSCRKFPLRQHPMFQSGYSTPKWCFTECVFLSVLYCSISLILSVMFVWRLIHSTSAHCHLEKYY